ncbi:DUF3649 domain-containing protein [Cupriavidus nantongensis]
MSKASAASGWRYRAGVGARAVAAIAGGYALAALATAVLALFLPMARHDAVTAATLLSFAIYAGAAVWVFAVRSAWRACAGLALPAALLAAMLALGRGA